MSATVAELVDAGEAGDLQALAALDERGLLLGPGESLPAYAARIRTLLTNIASLRTELADKGTTEVCGIPLVADEAIAPEIFAEAAPVTRRLYGFAVDWVPGFFTNYKMGLLFAGCAWYSLEDFFAVFIVRRAFQKTGRWLIYSRTELIAHELCHIARIAFNSTAYEELFAYQTATSLFRRLIGGLLRSPLDTYVLLGSVGVLFAAQVANVLLRPPEVWQDFPMPLVWAGVVAAFVFIGGRYLAAVRRFRKVKGMFAKLTQPESVMPILFRCSDDELAMFADCHDADEMRHLLRARLESQIRWRLIAHRFIPTLAPSTGDSR